MFRLVSLQFRGHVSFLRVVHVHRDQENPVMQAAYPQRHKAVVVLINAMQRCYALQSGDNAECGLRSWNWTSRPTPDQKSCFATC